MTETVNIYDAKTQFSRLVERAEGGEEIVIARAGTPVARLVPVERKARRQPGLLRHLHIPEAFFDPLPPEEQEAWE